MKTNIKESIKEYALPFPKLMKSYFSDRVVYFENSKTSILLHPVADKTYMLKTDKWDSESFKDFTGKLTLEN